MNGFVHIGFAFPGVPKMLDLEPVISTLADDWIRYSDTSWILWTSRTPAEIHGHLDKHLDTNDCVLIIPFSTDLIAGKLPPWTWGWFNNKGAKVLTGPEAERMLSNYLALPKPK